MDAVFDSLVEQTPDTVKIPGFNDYERYKEFWNTRVFNSDTIKGDYSKYVEQLKLYSQNPSMAPAATTSNMWEFVSPKNLSSYNQAHLVFSETQADTKNQKSLNLGQRNENRNNHKLFNLQ